MGLSSGPAYTVVVRGDTKVCLCGLHLNEYIVLAREAGIDDYILEGTEVEAPSCIKCKELLG